MIQLSLQATANQNFTATLDGSTYDITLKTCDNATTATITRNGETLASNTLCVAATPLLPYKFQQDGNFIFLTANDDLPYYQEFGVTQFLFFATQAEIEAVLNG